MRGKATFPAKVALPVALWLALFLICPLLFLFAISLADAITDTPPFTALLDTARGGWRFTGDLDNYAVLAQEPLYLAGYLTSLKFATFSTLFCLLLGYPMAYAIASAPANWRPLLLALVILPFWTSFLLRVYAWMTILNANGLVNNALLALGLIEEPLALLHSDFAVYLGIVYTYLPFMILPLYAVLERLDRSLVEAACDLGASPWRAFLKVTLPLSMPGVAAGCLVVFLPAVGEFVIPELLGGSESLMIGRLLWIEFFANRDWPLAAAIAVAMLVLFVLPGALFRRLTERG
jgi:putrescine transport system permease protein